MRLLTTCLLTLILLLTSACQPVEPIDTKTQVKIRAEALIQLLQNQQWFAAADYVLIDQKAKERLQSLSCPDKSKPKQCLADFFQILYKNQKPGDIFNITHPNSKDQDLVLVTYRHGDIDGFYMRLYNDQWWYAFN